MAAPVPVTLSPVVAQFSAVPGPVRLGMIVLVTDLTSERDAARLIPAGHAALHVARVAFENPSTPENLRRMGPRLTGAAELLAPIPDLAAILYSCTAASVEIGDREVADAIGSACPGVPVVTPPDAAVDGFRALGIRRIALVTPYLVETTRPMARYFAERGLEVVSAECLGIADDRDIARVTPATIAAAAGAADRAGAEGIFISCTALPSMTLAAEIEAQLKKPVITSNQAGLWRMLHHAGLPLADGVPGRLFEVEPRAG